MLVNSTTAGDRLGAAAVERWRRGLPWLTLGQLPTRISEAPRLGGELGLELYVKRDDESAPGYGGNKVRKLELVLAAAQARGARRVITVGGLGSNQVVATAYYCRQVGLACAALLLPQPVTPLVRANLRAALACGAELLAAPSWARAPLAAAGVARLLGRGSYLIGPGASSPLGTVGYVAAALELAAQVEAGDCPEPGSLVVPLGSGGTAAGLLLGLSQTCLRTRVVAVRVVHQALAGSARTVALARRTASLLSPLEPGLRRVRPERLTVLGEFCGAGYGAVTPEATRAVARAEELEGLRLETTYTGKALAALVARRAELPGPVLFWHTFNAAELPSLEGQDHRVPPALRHLVAL